MKRAKQYTSLIPPKPKKTEDTIEPWSPGPPTVYVEVDVPLLKNMDVGSEFTFSGKGRLTAAEVRESGRGSARTKKMNYRFELLGMAD